jgi:hypothetical protein
MVTRTGPYRLRITTAALLAASPSLAGSVGCGSNPSAGGSGSPADASVLDQTNASADTGAALVDAAAADGPPAAGANADAGSPDAASPDAANPDGAAEAGPAYACNPATLLDNPTPWESCPGPSCVCYGYGPDAGGLDFDWSATIMSITSVELPVAMTAGQPYSLSITVSDGGFTGDVEFWGATSQCGPGWQQLYSAPLASKTYCADVNPTQDYTYVLYVERMFTDSGAPSSESDYNHLACPTGRCNASP